MMHEPTIASPERAPPMRIDSISVNPDAVVSRETFMAVAETRLLLDAARSRLETSENAAIGGEQSERSTT